MAAYSSHTLPSRGGGGGGGHFYSGSAGLMEKIHEMLTERECSIFNEGLAAYHKRRDVSRFVESLSLVLNTNGKRQLLVPIRNQFIKPSDLIKFNDLSIKYGIALPLKGNTAKSGKKMFNKTQTGPKVLEIKRDEKGEWGFSIRGGIDHGIGIFVSWVDRGSNAEKAGLKVGDYIHRVNEVGLEGLTFAQATQIFRNRSKIRMVITSYGRIPGFQFANKSFRWVNREGKPVLPPTEIESLGMTSGGHVDPNVRKVSFTVESGQVLGISIRGGAEHGLGIYVSEVDAGSVAETNGIKRGEQILEVNGISYINILHPDAAKGLKEERVMTMRLKDIGKLPHSKIPPVVPQTWQQEPSVAASHTTRSMRSLPGTMKKGTEYTDSSKPAEGTGGTPVMITKRTLTPGRGIMNEVAESLLTKSEMTTFTYYITKYEHNQISVESLVESLLKLLNTEKKMNLIGEVRNIIREKDLDLYNELTAQKELQSFRASKSLYDSDDDDMAVVHAINGIKTPQKGFNDDDSLDDVPQRFQTVPITIHPPPPPPREGDTSTPRLIATSMKDRRRNLHESIMEDDSWEDSTLPRPFHTNTVDNETMKRKMKEIEEKTKLELEEQLKKEYEEQLAEKLRAEQEEIERIKEEMRLEKEAMEKQLQDLSAKEGGESITDKEKLEEEIWKQAEESLRQELKDQIEKESQQKLKEEYDKLLETSLAEERKKTEAERKMREELEKKQREKNVIEREKEEQKRIEIEDRARHNAEDKARREYEQRLQRESEEKARLAEEIKSYRSIKMEMESERDQKERLEKAKKNAERKAEEEEAEKEKIRKKLKKEKEEAEERAEKEEAEKRKIEKQLKREKEDAEEKAEREAAEKLKLKALLEKKEKELEEKEREHAEREAALKAEQKKQKAKQQQVKPVQQVIRKEPEAKEESEDEEEGMDEDEEEELRRQEEEELRRQEEEEERRREEERKKEEKRKQQERKKAKQEEERKKRQQERELARQAEEERLRRMREEEERQQQEEEQRRQREEEEERRMREVEERRQREEEEEERRREEEERKRMEERRLSKEGSFFDPVLMDELVISSLPTQAPAPTGGSSASSRPHVTFQDQKQKEQKIIENERKLAEQMLAVRLREKKNESIEEEGRFSFAGYTNLKGTMAKVTVKKVNKKLGIAVDGGSNTKQKAVIVRQVVPDGSAALTGKDLEIGQQILAVNGKSLKGLKHKDAVMAIKNAFDGPMQKVIEFDMLIPDAS